MAINQVGSALNLDTLLPKLQPKTQSPLNKNTGSTVSTNKDILTLSEKAKDLLAQQTGKTFQEEQGESMATQLKENE